MSGICVIGLGSAHGDDRIGWELLRLLEANAAVNGSVRLHSCATVGGELLALWKDADLVILVDAVRGAGLPGTAQWISLHPRGDDAAPDVLRSFSSHGIGLSELIELAAVLGVLPRRLLLFGVEIDACAPLGELSAPVRAGLPCLAAALESAIVTASEFARADT